MRLTNTLTGTVEQFEPLTAGRAGVYVCGVSPYAESHVGHAMSAIVYDVLVRYLRWEGNAAGGYDVTFVSNYTDIDDNLIERARELGRHPMELVDENIAQWEQEQQGLGLIVPDERPRVTREIESIVALTERIIASEHAYATAEGNVYFRVRSSPDYGKLSHRNIGQLLSGTRFEPGEDKEYALDFALWKAQKPGEPSWPSPWGDGRPGWHIECSAMSTRYLGEAFDIHGGGIDLIFPHHENEIAQSQAAGSAFASLWLHNGMVLRDGEKMSKSIGNVVSVREALLRWSPDAIRLFALNSHYRSQNNLTDEAMTAAERGVARLTEALTRTAGDGGTPIDAAAARLRFVEAMEEDLNTAQALAALFDLATAINRAIDSGGGVDEARTALRELAAVLGLRLDADSTAATALDVGALDRVAARFGIECPTDHSEASETVEAILQFREDARRDRDFALADGIREALAAAGVEIQDGPGGVEWSVRG